jgi:hypothetical protein
VDYGDHPGQIPTCGTLHQSLPSDAEETMAIAREPFEWTFSGVEVDAKFLVLLMAFDSEDPNDGTTIRFSDEADARSCAEVCLRRLGGGRTVLMRRVRHTDDAATYCEIG